MPQRITCEGCQKRVRVENDKGWQRVVKTERRPVTVELNDSGSFQNVMKDVVTDPGRRQPKYRRCRPCFRDAYKKRRPVPGRTKKAHAAYTRKPKAAPQNQGKPKQSGGQRQR